jgi:hypothetical protein
VWKNTDVPSNTEVNQLIGALRAGSLRGNDCHPLKNKNGITCDARDQMPEEAPARKYAGQILHIAKPISNGTQ